MVSNLSGTVKLNNDPCVAQVAGLPNDFSKFALLLLYLAALATAILLK